MNANELIAAIGSDVNTVYGDLTDDVVCRIEELIMLRLGDHRNSVRVKCGINCQQEGRYGIDLEISADNEDSLALAEMDSNDVLNLLEAENDS